MAIDYGLGVRQAAINQYVQAERGKAEAEEAAKREREKQARQQRKGLMSLALHAGAAVATGGASIPYSMKYGGMVNQALMGDDYQGSDMQALQGLGSAVYQGAQGAKAKQLGQMESMHKQQLDGIYKSIDALPADQVMERARLANQATELTTQFHKNFKSASDRPAWEYLTSEREKQTAKTTGGAEPGTSTLQPQKVEEAISGGGLTSDQIDQVYSGMEVPKENDFESTQNILQGEANRREGLMNITQDKAGFGKGELSDKAGGFGRYQTNLAQEVSQEEVDRRNAERRNRRRFLPQGGLGTGAF